MMIEFNYNNNPDEFMAFQLTQQQRNFFDVFGYLKLSKLFSNEAVLFQQVFDELYQAEQALDWQHEAHYNKSRLIIFNFLEKHPALRKLITHENIQALFRPFLGNNYTYMASEGNIFSGDTYWHSDIYGCHFKYRYMKALFYLDTLKADSGALCVIPGSHLFGDQFANKLEGRVWEHEKHLGISKEDVPHVAIETEPGDVIIFDNRLKHATINKTDSKRRLFSVYGVQRFEDGDEDKLLKIFADAKKLGSAVHTQQFIDTLTDTERYRIEQTLHLLNKHQISAY